MAQHLQINLDPDTLAMRVAQTALRTAQSAQTRKAANIYIPDGAGTGVLIGDTADAGISRYDPVTETQSPLWEGISQEELDAKANEILGAASADTATRIAQVNKDIEATSKKIDETAEKTLADANAAAQEKVDAVSAKVDAAQAKADANAAAIEQTNKTVEANKQAADEAQAQLDKTLTEHGSILTSVNEDLAQAKKDILANTTMASSAESKADAANKTATAAAGTATSAASTASNAITVANTTAELVKQYGDRSVVSSVIEYATSTSDSVAPEDCVTWWEGTPNDSVSVLALCWDTAMPEHKTGEYTWMRTRLTYGDGSEAVSAPALITGDKGAQGEPGEPGAPGGQGVSVTGVTNFWALALSEPAQPTDKTPGSPWTVSEPAYDRAKQLYMCSRVDYSNGTWSYTTVTMSSAYKASQEAETAARDAIETARNAETTANTAKQTADASKNESAEAKTIAQGADATATQANATATAANQAATSAATAANSAKQDAANAAGIANGKADVLIQSTEPATDMRKATTLWIDTTNGANTPKRWDGSVWVAVTDKKAVDAANAAATAQASADTAQSTANEAKTMAANADAKAVGANAAAVNAQTTADSKNTVYMQPTDPHDEPDKAKRIVPGDLWWQTSDKAPETYWTGAANNSVSVLVDYSGEIVHMWVWNGSRWNNHVLYAQDMLVNGSIVSELLAVDCVEARHIKVGAIEADKLAATALYGKVIKGGRFLTANERLVIDNEGLLLKDSGGNATITMNAANGSATFMDVGIVDGALTTPSIMAGDIEASTIHGSTVTGGTVQTVADANRGIKLTGGNLDIYRADQKRFLRANEAGVVISDGTKNVLTFAPIDGEWVLSLDGAIQSGGDISGATITAPILQTSREENTGLKFTSGGLVAYDTSRNVTFTLDNTGRIMMAGALLSNGEITGATLQTYPDADKGVKILGSELVAYSDDGKEMINLDGRTGNAVLTGGLRTARAGSRIVIGAMNAGDDVGLADIIFQTDYGQAWDMSGAFVKLPDQVVPGAGTRHENTQSWTLTVGDNTALNVFRRRIGLGDNTSSGGATNIYYTKTSVNATRFEISMAGNPGIGDDPAGVYVNNRRIDDLPRVVHCRVDYGNVEKQTQKNFTYVWPTPFPEGTVRVVVGCESNLAAACAHSSATSTQIDLHWWNPNSQAARCVVGMLIATGGNANL